MHLGTVPSKEESVIPVLEKFAVWFSIVLERGERAKTNRVFCS